MSARELRFGIFGTFDVQNYGDLLFPLIAEAELSQRLGPLTLRRFSYHDKAPPQWPYTVTSLSRLPDEAVSLDGVIIGGGHARALRPLAGGVCGASAVGGALGYHGRRSRHPGEESDATLIGDKAHLHEAAG